MIDFSPFPAFFLAAFLICVAPGPDQAFIIATAAANGRVAGFLAALGMAVGIATYTVLAALGLAVVLDRVPGAVETIRIVGAVYLLYLAWETFISLRAAQTDQDVGTDGFTAMRQGLTVNLTNPKIMLFFASFLPQFLGSATSSSAQFLLLGLLFLIVGLAVDSSVALIAGQVRESQRSGQRTRTGLTVLAGSTYSVLAAVLIFESITA